MVAVCRIRGMSAQQAFDTLNHFLEQRYLQWDETIAKVPLWDRDVEAEVQKYITGIQNVVRANLYWR